jgi:hypothetical protein
LIDNSWDIRLNWKGLQAIINLGEGDSRRDSIPENLNPDIRLGQRLIGTNHNLRDIRVIAPGTEVGWYGIAQENRLHGHRLRDYRASESKEKRACKKKFNTAIKG